MFPTFSRCLATVLCLALLAAPHSQAQVATYGPDAGRPAPGALGLLPALVGELLSVHLALAPLPAPAPMAATGGESDATLDELTAKQIQKSQAQMAKLAKAIAKLDSKLAALTLVEADTSAVLQPLLDAEPAQLATVADAQQALVDALALPVSTPAEKAARKLAVKLAKKAASVAKKALKKTQKGIGKLQKKLAKTQGKLAVLTAKSAALADDMEAVDEDLDLLLTPFDFQSSEIVQVSVRVEDKNGQPIPFARISWTDVLLLPDPATPPGGGKGKGKGKSAAPLDIEELASVAVYGQAFADDAGMLQMDITVPVHIDSLDVIVQAEGYTGPYTDEGLRELWDVFAPSARFAVTREGLADLTITLTEDEE